MLVSLSSRLKLSLHFKVLLKLHETMADTSVRAFASGIADAYFKDPISLNFVDGKRVAPAQPTKAWSVYEPATGNVMCKCPGSGSRDVDEAIRVAREAFRSWSQLSGLERGRILQNAARKLMQRKEEFARIESMGQGKPAWEAMYDIDTVIDALDFYGGLAPSITGEHLQLPGGSFGITRKEPLGVCVGIGAWNYPMQMAGWKSAPALACGNTMVFKPSPFTPLTAVMYAELLVESGVPPGVFNVLQGEGDTGHDLSSHPGVNKVSFTGSVPTGKKVMTDCSTNITRVTLELGGKSPLIIFADADLDNAVKGAMMANFLTQGEVCSNGTRVFVEKSIKPQFVEKLVAKTKAMTVGNPYSDDTNMGALITKEHLERVLGFVETAKKEGGNILCGGERVVPSDPTYAGGYYMSPCVIDNVSDDMTVAQQEIFGPVLSLFEFESEEEVIRRANDTIFGLAAGVFTRDLKRAHTVTAQLEAGSIWINNFNLTPAGLPFGGFKQSGIGRENAKESIDLFTQSKSVYVEMGGVDCPY